MKMKKVLALSLAAVTALGIFAGCGSKTEDKKENTETTANDGTSASDTSGGEVTEISFNAS